MALKHEPTAPYHSAQDALRVLETVAPARHRSHRRRARPAHRPRPRAADHAPADAAPRGLRRADRRRGVRHRRGPQPARLRAAAASRRCARSSSAPWTGCATRSAPPSTSAGTSTARSRSPSTPTGPTHPGGQRVGRLPLLRARHRDRQEPARPARPQRPARPPLPAQDGPPHLAHDHQRQAAAVPPGDPAADRARSSTSRSTRSARSARPSRSRAGSAVGCLALSLPVEHAHRLRQAADTLNRERGPGAAVPGDLVGPGAPGALRTAPAAGPEHPCGPGSIFSVAARETQIKRSARVMRR